MSFVFVGCVGDFFSLGYAIFQNEFCTSYFCGRLELLFVSLYLKSYLLASSKGIFDTHFIETLLYQSIWLDKVVFVCWRWTRKERLLTEGDPGVEMYLKLYGIPKKMVVVFSTAIGVVSEVCPSSSSYPIFWICCFLSFWLPASFLWWIEIPQGTSRFVN